MARTHARDAGIADKAKAAAADAQERTGAVIDSARGKAGNLQATVADRLDARGHDRPAIWLREHDLTDLGGLIEQQLRERPGRTALIALVVGILLGRAVRR